MTDDIYTLLNLACLKATGSYLPESCATANNWKYIEDDAFPPSVGSTQRKKFAVWSPSPFFDPLSLSASPNDFHHQVKRQLIVDELKTINLNLNFSKRITEEFTILLWKIRGAGQGAPMNWVEGDAYYQENYPETYEAVSNSIERVLAHPDRNIFPNSIIPRDNHSTWLKLMYGFDTSMGILERRWRWGDCPAAGEHPDYEGMFSYIELLYQSDFKRKKLMYKFFNSIPFYSNPKSVKNNWAPWFNEPPAIIRARNLCATDYGYRGSVFNWFAPNSRRDRNLSTGQFLEAVENSILNAKIRHLEEENFMARTTWGIKKNKKSIQSYYEFILMAIGMSYNHSTLPSCGAQRENWKSSNSYGTTFTPFTKLDTIWKNKRLNERLADEPILPHHILIRVFTDKDKEYQKKEKKRIERKIKQNFYC